MKKGCAVIGVLAVVVLAMVVVQGLVARHSDSGRLYISIMNGDVKAVKLLLHEHPALVNHDYGGGTRPIHYAASAHKAASPIVELLLSTGADPNAADAVGDTPVMSAAARGSGDTVAVLLHHGADPNVIGARGYTALHFAAKRGDAGVVCALIKGGADVTTRAKASRDYTPLHYAARFGRRDIAVLLMNAGADVNAKSCDGNPVQIARRYGYDQIAQALMKHAKPGSP